MDLEKSKIEKETQTNDELKESDIFLAKQEEYLSHFRDLNHRLATFRDNLTPYCDDYEEDSEEVSEVEKKSKKNFEEIMSHFLEQERKYGDNYRSS